MFITRAGEGISPEEIRYYLEENVEDYANRRRKAWNTMSTEIVSLRRADKELYEEIEKVLCEFCIINDVYKNKTEFKSAGLDMECFLL